jgi:polyhydroxyalkanoate synthesis regulator phasin
VVARAKRAGGLPDALRRAVERTFESTLGSTVLTRERAQELADEVLRRAEDRATRAGRGVRDAGRGVREAGQRPREAAAGVGDRVRDAIADLRFVSVDEVRQLRREVAGLRERVDKLERKLSTKGATGRRKSASATRASKTRRSKRSGAS